jgi:L-ribulokinase
MGKLNPAVYRRDQNRADAFDRLHVEYATLHDSFDRGQNEVMHRLMAIKQDAVVDRSAGSDEKAMMQGSAV